MISLILATIFFSISFGLIKANLATLDPNLVSFLRLFFASMIFLPVFILKKNNVTKKDFIQALLIGTIQFGLMFIFYIQAFKFLKGSEIVLLTTSTPFFVLLISSIYSKKIDFIQILLVAIAIFGGFFVVFRENSLNFAILGIVFMELSNLSFALGQILWKKQIDSSSSALMFPAYFGACLLALFSSFLFSKTEIIKITNIQWFSILYLAIIPTGIGFWLWNMGAKKVSETTLSVMNNLKIPIGAIFAILFFKESVKFENFTIGLLLILIAIFGSIIYKGKEE
ncbi:EamA family transporter [bacterium]|nr:EamA family transporter [bacterium]